jgi:hypothetical protein
MVKAKSTATKKSKPMKFEKTQDGVDGKAGFVCG